MAASELSLRSPPRLGDCAASWARLAINNIESRFPQRIDAVQLEKQSTDWWADHPSFSGSFDWHSCVHMQWLLVRLLRLVQHGDWRADAHRLLARRMDEAALSQEYGFFQREENAAFERPYGWAWVAQLHTELTRFAEQDATAASWSARLAQLAGLLMERLIQAFEAMPHPVRAGTHGNTAFASMLATGWAQLHNPALVAPIRACALRWYAGDRAYPFAYEPDGEDFLSGGLMESALMSRMLPAADFSNWWMAFTAGAGERIHTLEPVLDVDMRDGRRVHLAGLNLSRAWCYRMLQSALPDPLAAEMGALADRHLEQSLQRVISGSYAGDHWLASFALLALTEGG